MFREGFVLFTDLFTEYAASISTATSLVMMIVLIFTLREMIMTRRFSYVPKLMISIPLRAFGIWQEDPEKRPVPIPYGENAFQVIVPRDLSNDPASYLKMREKGKEDRGDDFLMKYFSITNEGNGMAYDIAITYQVDLCRIVALSNNPAANISIQYKELNFGIPVFGINSASLIEKKKIIENCGNRGSGHTVSAVLPYGFILILASWAKYVVSLHQEMFDRGLAIFEGPSLFLELRYKDLGGRYFKDKYQVKFRIAEFLVKQENFPRELMSFRSYLEPVSSIHYSWIRINNYLFSHFNYLTQIWYRGSWLKWFLASAWQRHRINRRIKKSHKQQEDGQKGK